MSLPLPTSLTPSKVAAFKDCPLAFRLSVIDGLPEAPSPHAVKGTLVHRALQLLMFEHEPPDRTPEAAHASLTRAVAEVLGGDEGAALALEGAEQEAFVADAAALIGNYFRLEDPASVRVLGTELLLDTTIPGGIRLRGIIDRLELDGDGALVVTDYKTGRAPSAFHEQARMAGVHFYAYLCQAAFGRLPARVRLLHLREPLSITTVPTVQSVRGLDLQARAVWTAVEQACADEDFRPSPGRLCTTCAYRDYCPAVGGDLTRVPVTLAG